ncbi:MAG: hypothetical protein ACPIOQ_66060 [Promethearchaeia archaeon]
MHTADDLIGSARKSSGGTSPQPSTGAKETQDLAQVKGRGATAKPNSKQPRGEGNGARVSVSVPSKGFV